MKDQVLAVVLILLVAGGLGAGYFMGGASQRTATFISTSVATSTATITATSVTTYTTTTTVGTCLPASGAMPWPSYGPDFVAWVNYSGSWTATTTVFNGSSALSPVFAGCYTGDGPGYFLYENPAISNTTTATVTAQKTDNGTGALWVTINGNWNATNALHGSATVTGLADVFCSRIKPTCPWAFITADYWGGTDGFVEPVSTTVDAVLFNCRTEASSPQGCTQVVPLPGPLSPFPPYTITIWYPFTNATEPSWANCLWKANIFEEYALCVPIGSNSFVVAQQAGPPR